MTCKKSSAMLIGAAALLIAVLLCAGCVQNGGDSAEKDLTFVFNQGPESENNLDPSVDWDGWYTRRDGIYQTLFYYDTQMNLKPELATSYKSLSDTEWEITLREGVLFHDGTKFNADAVIFSYNRVLDPSNSRSSEYSFIKEVKKTGEYTVVIETAEPYAPLIATLTDPLMSIVSPNIVNAASNPVGTGPYEFVSASNGAKDVYLKKNENYWGGSVGCDTVHIILNSDGTARTLMIKSGDADIIRDPVPSEYPSLNTGDLMTMSVESMRAYFLCFNEAKAPFDNVKVRQALSYALDKQEIVDTALEGVSGTPAVGIYSSNMKWNANDKITHYDYNPEKALELLAEAGITKGSDGKLMYNGEPFTIEIVTYTSRSALPASLEVIAAQYEELGVKVVVKHVDKVDPLLNAGDYDMAVYSAVTAPTGDPDYFLKSYFLSTSAKAKNWFHYSNAQIDEWIAEGRTTMDEAKRQEIYDKIQIKLQDDAVICNVFFGVEGYAMTKSVKGFEAYPNDYTYITKDITMN